MSKMQAMLKAKLAENLEKHSMAKKEFDGFDVYQDSRLETIAISDIKPNPAQPRTEFDDESLQELADSIEKNGLLQPITVRKASNGYHIVAGERRLRAHKLLNKTSVECLVVHISDEQNALLALAENLSRADLSDYETALAVDKIKDTFASKTELAKALGISRAKLYKLLAFLELPKSILFHLKDTPSLISADTAEQIKTLQKELALPEAVFGGLLLDATIKLKSGELKQSHLYDFIISGVSDRTGDKPADTTAPEVKAPATSNVRKMYVRDGVNIGKVKADGKKFVVELTAQTLSDEQEEELMKFLDTLLGQN